MQTHELLDTAKRRRFVLDQREEGLTYQQIADLAIEVFGRDALPRGWDRRYAWQDVQRELKRIQAYVSEKARNVLQLELRRLDRMQAALQPDVLDGDAEVGRLVLRIMERRAKLMGLDKSEEVNLSGETIVKVIKGNLMEEV